MKMPSFTQLVVILLLAASSLRGVVVYHCTTTGAVGFSQFCDLEAEDKTQASCKGCCSEAKPAEDNAPQQLRTEGSLLTDCCCEKIEFECDAPVMDMRDGERLAKQPSVMPVRLFDDCGQVAPRSSCMPTGPPHYTRPIAPPLYTLHSAYLC